MRLFSDRNDRMLLGAAGILLGTGALVAAGIAVGGPEADLMTTAAHAAMSTDAPYAHNVPATAPASIIRSPSDLPGSVGGRGPESVRVALETIERLGDLGDGTTYRYWTFNGQVPGPFVRVSVGDTLEVSPEEP
jgi:nitrite reductase (NO-forming)